MVTGTWSQPCGQPVILDSKLYMGGSWSYSRGAQGSRPLPTPRLQYPSREQNRPPLPMKGPCPGEARVQL